ncbi:LysR family transcriptional regulator [Affinibrenneria salicis]|uniref:LysR family transcriptional regulator n=1 Tax=Affinibrenneria salicis TaxID=2590031 RepID=A0A5J5FSF8_9GAMM|nr:LysR substrate-binding domain-containing protein [Affinibrenneria salicis]KAA8995281.1 LysR family transcriptional regulator [Affinibrenneria salicis]
MDLTQLRMLCLVAETGSVARAAEHLQRVPSNLTTRLRQLEQELGVSLFIREKQRLRLSPVGHNFLCYAQRILALSEEAMDMTRSGEPGGHFALGATESAAATRLPELLAAFHQRHPQVALALSVGTSCDMIDRVRAGTLACALVDGPLASGPLHGCMSFSDRLVLISARQHAPVLTARDAAGEPLFTFPPGCTCRQRLETWFRQDGVPPGAINEVHSWHAMLAGVAGGAGLALLPHAVLARLPGREQVRLHALPEPIADAPTWLIWRRDAFGPNIEALKKLIIEHNDR